MRNKSIDEMINDLGYILLNEYTNKWNQKMVSIQDAIGYKYDVEFNSLMIGSIPDFVGVNNPHSLENIKLWLRLNRPEFDLCDDNTYKGATNKLNFFHNSTECQEYFISDWSKIYGGRGCAICRGYQVGKYNNLAYLRPDLVEEWNYEKNELRPEEITVSSGKKVWWICEECDYDDWFVPVYNRTNGNGCPSCAGRVVSDRNRLSILYPEISSEWHPTKNGNLTPHDVSYGIAKKIWWLCSKGHEYLSSINSRTSKESGCKQCSDERQESTIATELKFYFANNYHAKNEYKILRNSETNYWLPFDIYIPAGSDSYINGYYIEIHGRQHYEFSVYHHKTIKEFEDSQHRDKIKKKFARKNGIYIEIDLRKIRTVEEATNFVESALN